VDANPTRNRLVESEEIGQAVAERIRHRFCNLLRHGELKTACINYENKFVITAAVLGLLTQWGIADKTRKTCTYANTKST
jgi:hypothetical protein